MAPVPTSQREAAWMGAVAVSPILLGVAPFGLIAGLAAVDIGLGVAEAAGFSTLIFAGASQLAALDLLGREAPVAVAVVTALVINLRFLMYGASLAPHLSHESWARRSLGAYLLTDQAYAISIARYQDRTDELPTALKFPYYVGAGAALWTTWQATTLAGTVVGDAVPESFPLTFAVPVTFLALLVPALVDRPAVVAAVVSAAVATAGAGWPANLGMLTGAVSGIVTGALASERSRTEGPRP